MTRVSVDDDGFPSVPVPRRAPSMPEYPQVHYEVRYCNSFGEPKVSGPMGEYLEAWQRAVAIDMNLTESGVPRPLVHVVEVSTKLVEVVQP